MPKKIIPTIIEVTPTNPWEKAGILWKPVAEHVGKPVVVTLPRGQAEKVQVLDKNKVKIKTLKFRSVGDAGDAWQDFTNDALFYREEYKSIYVRVFYKKNVIKDMFIKNPLKRSDGKPGEGNYVKPK